MDKLYVVINYLFDKICLLIEESVVFVNGVVIIIVYMVKGLEFDEVIVLFVIDKNYRIEIDCSMLYVVCICVMYKFYIFVLGNISIFLL